MTEQPALTFAGLLRQLRSGAKLTQEDLAGAAGVSARSVSDLERGVNRTARKDTAALLADGLSELQLRTRRFTFRSRSPEDLLDTFRINYGPTLRAFEQAADPAALEADLLDLVRRRNRLAPADGSVAIDAMYLEAIGTRC